MQGSRALTEEELKKLLEIASPRDRLFMMTGMCFGTRISEALKLTFGDVEGKTLRLKSSKGSHNQEFPIPDSYKAAVKEVRLVYRELGIDVKQHTKMFLSTHLNSHKVISRQNASEIIQRLAKLIGAEGKVSSHSFRKSFVTRIYERTGFNIAETQKYSRHKSLGNLQYYIATTDKMDLVSDSLWG